MRSKNETNILIKKYEKQAKNSEWCDLANSIIDIEHLVLKEKEAKQLKLLNLQLEILEKEKSSRIFKSFDMEYFVNREYEDSEPDYF